MIFALNISPYFTLERLQSSILIRSGIDKCDPTKDEWEGYEEDCCTTSSPCGEKQGGCSSTEACGGASNVNLVCSASSTGCGSNFNTASGEKCCHLEGNKNRTLHDLVYIIYFRCHQFSNY